MSAQFMKFTDTSPLGSVCCASESQIMLLLSMTQTAATVNRNLLIERHIIHVRYFTHDTWLWSRVGACVTAHFAKHELNLLWLMNLITNYLHTKPAPWFYELDLHSCLRTAGASTHHIRDSDLLPKSHTRLRNEFKRVATQTLHMSDVWIKSFEDFLVCTMS